MTAQLVTARAKIAIAFILALAASAIAAPPLIWVDGASTPPGATLAVSIGYVLLAPWTRLLDELSLLEVPQHIALAATVLLLAVVAASRAARRAHGWPRARAATARFAIIVGSLVLLYAIGALAPRPMARLVLNDDRNQLLVDFHSHTERSHDGRWRFDLEDNRDWHTGGGFHAAYITDHQTMAAWREGGPLAPEDSTQAVLLPGIETHMPGVHVNLLGVDSTHAHFFLKRREVDTVGLDALVRTDSSGPLLLLTLPFDTLRIRASYPVYDAVELTDGSPKGLRFSRHHRQLLVGLADSANAALVSGANMHGWGRTATAWTIIAIPQWRRFTALQLDSAIRAELRQNPRGTTVIERTRLSNLVDGPRLVLVLPALLVRTARLMTIGERIVTAAWIIAIVLFVGRRPASTRRESP